MMGIGMGFAGIGLIWMLLFWGALFFGGFWLVRSLAGATARGRAPEGLPRPISAQEILAQRYARGEISREEFEQARRDLNA